MEKPDRKSKQTKTDKPIKIVIVGSESTGKSTLAKKLAEHYNTVWVKEFLREFADAKLKKGEDLVYVDNIDIIDGQLRLLSDIESKANKFIFCDTDAIQTYVYSFLYYKKVQQSIIDTINKDKNSIYLLLNNDVEWMEDVLRDKTKDRNDTFSKIEDALNLFEKKYFIVSGIGDRRINNAIKLINNL